MISLTGCLYIIILFLFLITIGVFLITEEGKRILRYVSNILFRLLIGAVVGFIIMLGITFPDYIQPALIILFVGVLPAVLIIRYFYLQDKNKK